MPVSRIRRRVHRACGLAAGGAVALLLVGGAAVADSATEIQSTSAGSLPLKGSSLPTGDGAAANAYADGDGSQWNVLNWGPGVQANSPASYSRNYVDSTGRTQQQIFVSTGANPDVGTAASNTNWSISNDSGKSFLTTVQNQTQLALAMWRKADGSLVSVDFIPAWRDDAHTQVNLIVRTSTDGSTWTPHNAPVTMPADHLLGPMTNGLRVNKDPIVLKDGTILLSAYTVFKGSTRQTSIVLQSTDGGASWTLRSVIPAAATPGTNEVGWSYTTDGRLTAIMRTVDLPITNLVQSFSDDNGLTWSESKPVIAPSGKQAQGILPGLLLQPNGTLLLLTGRPDVRVLTDYDGTATHWDTETTLFANYPSTGNNGRFDGASANDSANSVSANRSVVFYDQCAPWGCTAYNQQFGVSAKYFSAVTPGTGLIDVASKLIDKTATVTGTFAPSNDAFPEQRPAGAFDGSKLAGAEAVLSAEHGPSSLVLALDRSYNLDKIGLMLGHGFDPQSATVQLSADGVHWSAPVVNAKGEKDFAMRYTTFAAQPARYVKVSGPPGVTTTVSEMELYASDVDTFENEVAYGIPRGWTAADHAWVSDLPNNLAYSNFGGYHSSTALQLFDKWTDDNARITRPFPATSTVTASMQWGYADARANFTIGVGGSSAGTAGSGWEFTIVPGATATAPQIVRAFDGTAWQTVGTMNALIPARTYVPLSISATAGSATLTVNGQSFTTQVRAGAADTYDALTLTTGDPAQYGGFYLIDDVAIQG